MTENPFEQQSLAETSPFAPPAEASRSSDRPAWSRRILILTVIFGFFGLFGSVATIASPWVSEWMLNLAGTSHLTESQIEAQDEMMELAKQDYIPNLIFALMNFVVAGLLFVGGISGLRKKSSAFKQLNIGYLMAIVFVVLRTIYGCIVFFMSYDERMALSIKQAGPQAEQMRGLIEAFSWVGIAISLGVTLLLIAFYWFSRRWLNSTSVKKYLGVPVS